MTNEQKAKEISQQWWGCGKQQQITAYESALEAMEWKGEQIAKEKQQWIDKAAEWVEQYLFDIGYPDDWLRDSPNTTNGKTRFIQAMKGE